MKDQTIFQYARVSLFWNNFTFIVVRLLFFILLVFEIIVFLIQGIFPKFYIGIFSSLAAIEVFFYFGIEGVKSNFGSFTLESAKLLISSYDVNDLVKKLLKKGEVKFFLIKVGIEANELSVLQDITMESVLQEVQRMSREEKLENIFALHLFIAIILLSEAKTKLLFKKELKEKDVLHIARWTRHYFKGNEVRSIPKISMWGKGIGDDWVSGWTLETKKYTVDLTSKVASDPPHLVGRKSELIMLTEMLEKSERKNVLLVGPAGVGKTAIVQFFAYQSFLGNLPKDLSHRRVLELLSSSLLAGAENQGVLEERLRNMFEEIFHSQDIILYLPEMQNFAGGGGRKFDMSGVLMETLNNQKICVIGTITPENYKTFIEPLASFAELFEVVEVKEPELDEALHMLEEKSLYLEKKHRVSFAYKALYTTISLSSKYLPYRSLPGKAIELLDEAGAANSLKQNYTVEKKDIIFLIETKTHIPIGEPTKKEAELLLHFEDLLHTQIVDQEEAVKTVSEALRRLRSGIVTGNRPVGTFLFLGPTGVGKTETAKALSRLYFGSEESMIRLDMSEYQHEDSIHRLIGAPGIGSQSGELTEKVREKPFSLVLLDEFEKANPKILDIFLQVFDDGRLTDNKARIISFIDTILIATSNAGSELIREKTGEGVSLDQLKPFLLDALQKQGIFKPELLNRFDAVVIFEPLGEKEVQAVTKLLLEKVVSQLNKKDIIVSFDEKIVAKIAKEGFDPQFGARPLRRFIQDYIEDLLAQKILKGEVKRGDTVAFSTDNINSLTVVVKESR